MFLCVYMHRQVADLLTVCTGLFVHRRRDLPKLFIKNNHGKRGKAIAPLCATHSRLTVRQAIGGIALRGWKKQMPLCNEADKVRNMTCTKTEVFSFGERCAHVQLVFHCEIIWRTT
jgi:hypothetical protein